jgi:hypothetical protein
LQGKNKSKIKRHFAFYLARLVRFYSALFGGFDDFLAFVVAAFGAYAVGHLHLVALGAFDDARGGELPVGAAFVAARFGHFALGYCHVCIHLLAAACMPPAVSRRSFV